MEEKQFKLSPKQKKEFEEISLQYMDMLYSYSLRLTRNSEEAEDLVQDTYFRAYRFFSKFQQGTNFKAWIFRILINNFINKYRKDSRLPQKVDFEKVAFVLEDEINSTSSQVENALEENKMEELFDDDVNRALSRLSEEFRQIIILADVEQLTYKEIAEKMGIPLGTVMSRLFRGRKILQRSLFRYANRKGYVTQHSYA